METKIYIGSNNETKELELFKIIKVMEVVKQDFTLYTATGFWHGLQNNTP